MRIGESQGLVALAQFQSHLPSYGLATPDPAVSSEVKGVTISRTREVLCDRPTSGYTGFSGQDLAVAWALLLAKWRLVVWDGAWQINRCP